jgi:4-amino-4-deoxy-L-arabinose transferase-like glycosyltransferase
LVQRLLKHKLAVVLVISIVIRLGMVLVFPQVFAFDQTGAIHGSEAYDRYARNLIETGVYGKDTPGVPDAHFPPLYTVVLAAVYTLLGRGYMQVALLHILLDVLSITMLYHIARKLLPQGEWVGTLAGLFYAGYPYLIFQNLTLIDTPFFMTLLHAFVLLMVVLRERPILDRGTVGLAIVGGLILGLSLLTRALLPFLAILVALWFLFRHSLVQTIIRLLPVAIVALLTVVPWTLRNYAVFDTFVTISTNSGENFYQGNNAQTVPYFRAGYDVQWVGLEDDILAQIDDPFSPEASARRFAIGWQYLSENPGKIPELLWVKFLIHWSIDIAPRFNPTAGELPRLDYHGNVIASTNEGGNLQLGGLPEKDPVDVYSSSLFDQVGRTIHIFYFGGLFLLALLGVVLTRRQWRDVSLLWFVQISMTIAYLIFHPSTRYRVPSDPLLFVFSAYTLVWLWGWYQTRRNGQADKSPSAT